ncbi:MAG TPA: FliH/SctL family protein [Solirubrobacteraceae bacterium]|jgi:flagellar assembly protein FliH|nr:FliH/SctL family protein [Solirubrobacteraceae bacterium]
MTSTEFSFEALEAPAPVIAAPAPGEPGGPDAVMAALAAAEAEADALRAAARAEGLREGREEALAALAPALEALHQAAEGIQASQFARAERLEAHAVDLALFLAEKVIGGALAVQPELVVEAVRGAVRGIVERERVTVLVHPDDLELVRDAMDGLKATLGGIEHCEVQAERRVSRGGAVVRTPDGDVDARVETKLVRAREVVEAALGNASS